MHQECRSDYPQGSCHQAFRSLIKMGCGVHFCVCACVCVCVRMCRAAHLQCCVINDSRDERTLRGSALSAYSDPTYYERDRVDTNPPRVILKILVRSLTCAAASPLREHSRSPVALFKTRTHSVTEKECSRVSLITVPRRENLWKASQKSSKTLNLGWKWNCSTDFLLLSPSPCCDGAFVSFRTASTLQSTASERWRKHSGSFVRLAPLRFLARTKIIRMLQSLAAAEATSVEWTNRRNQFKRRKALRQAPFSIFLYLNQNGVSSLMLGLNFSVSALLQTVG